MSPKHSIQPVNDPTETVKNQVKLQGAERAENGKEKRRKDEHNLAGFSQPVLLDPRASLQHSLEGGLWLQKGNRCSCQVDRHSISTNRSTPITPYPIRSVLISQIFIPASISPIRFAPILSVPFFGRTLYCRALCALSLDILSHVSFVTSASILSSAIAV